MNLVKRVVVSLFAIPLLLYLLYLGGYYLLGLLSAISLFMSIELISMFGKKDVELPFWFSLFSPLFLFFFSLNLYNLSFLVFFLAIIIFAAKDIFLNNLKLSLFRISAFVFIVLYSGFMLSFLYKLSQYSKILPVLLLVLIWITDTGAYFVGMTLGKHRGFILASPNKSIEGFIGGFLFAILFGIAIALIFPQINFKISLLASLSSAIFGQFGDLFESIIKRDVSVKDSSNIIPGHGGVLDRFDSLLFAAPAFYMLLTFL